MMNGVIMKGSLIGCSLDIFWWIVISVAPLLAEFHRDGSTHQCVPPERKVLGWKSYSIFQKFVQHGARLWGSSQFKFTSFDVIKSKKVIFCKSQPAQQGRKTRCAYQCILCTLHLQMFQMILIAFLLICTEDSFPKKLFEKDILN